MRSRLVLSERGIEVVAQFTCPMRHITQTYNFLIDTGSSSSYLGWEDAAKAGIKVEELPSSSKPIFGFGGAADVKHLKEPCFLHVRFEGNTLETVGLPDGILVYRPSRRKTTHWRSGPSVSLLGRDFLRMSGWKLIADLPRQEAYLERP